MRIASVAMAFALIAFAGCAPSGDSFSGWCDRVEPQMCARIIAEVQATSGQPVGGLLVRCATGPCNGQEGEVTVEIRFSNGTSSARMIGWGLPAGPLAAHHPVVPTCEGVNTPDCRSLATLGWAEPDRSAVVAIHVRCTSGAVCRLDDGEGVTRVTLRSGEVREEHWASAPVPAPVQPTS